VTATVFETTDVVGSTAVTALETVLRDTRCAV